MLFSAPLFPIDLSKLECSDQTHTLLVCFCVFCARTDPAHCQECALCAVLMEKEALAASPQLQVGCQHYDGAVGLAVLLPAVLLLSPCVPLLLSSELQSPAQGSLAGVRCFWG